jgi:hypothetical protein
MRRPAQLATAAALVFVALSFADVLFLGKALYVRDIARVYVPERAILRTILRGGELPLWNPFFAAGQPFAANPEYEALYPPQWLALVPDLLFGVHLEIVLHLLFGAAGMAFFLTTLGARRTAAFGAVCFALGGVMLSATNLLPFLFALSWFPWAAACLHRYLDDPTMRRFAFSALTLGAIFAIGEPSTILQSVALAGSYAIARDRVRGALRAIAAGAAALLVGAVQLIPAIDHLRDCGRAAAVSYEGSTTWSLAPARLLELFLPNLFGHFHGGDLFYWGAEKLPWIFSWSLGLTAGALLIAAFAKRLPGWRFAAIAAAISYLLAIGNHGPLFPLVYRAGLSFIRYPEKWFLGGWFMLLVFAALAAERFFDDATFRRATFFAAMAIAVAAVIAFAAVRLWVVAPMQPEARAGALKTVAAAVVLVLILMLREHTRLCVALLALFTVIDLGTRVAAVAPRIDRHYYDEPPLARALPSPRAAVRIYNDADWRLALLPQPPTALAARLARNRELLLPQLQALWGFGSVLEADITHTNLQPSTEFNRLFWRAQLGGRADLVPLLLRAAGVTHVIELSGRVVALPGNARYSFAPTQGRVIAVDERANTIDLDVESAGNAALNIAVTPHKYWSATIDGNAAQLHVANVGFQSLIVPRGRHHVAMRYRNPLVIWCGAISLLTVLGLAAAALRSKGSPPPSPR